MAKDLYVIKGTGLALDGQIVTVVEEVGDYYVVSPPNSSSNIQNTMVKKACLQPLVANETFTYEITIYKRKSFKEDRLPTECIDSDKFVITGCQRNVSPKTIREYLESNLTQILRME